MRRWQSSWGSRTRWLLLRSSVWSTGIVPKPGGSSLSRLLLRSSCSNDASDSKRAGSSWSWL